MGREVDTGFSDSWFVCEPQVVSAASPGPNLPASQPQLFPKSAFSVRQLSHSWSGQDYVTVRTDPRSI